MEHVKISIDMGDRKSWSIECEEATEYLRAEYSVDVVKPYVEFGRN